MTDKSGAQVAEDPLEIPRNLGLGKADSLSDLSLSALLHEPHSEDQLVTLGQLADERLQDDARLGGFQGAIVPAEQVAQC